MPSTVCMLHFYHSAHGLFAKLADPVKTAYGTFVGMQTGKFKTLRRFMVAISPRTVND